MSDEIQMCLNCKMAECTNCIENSKKQKHAKRYIIRQIDTKTNKTLKTYASILSAAEHTGLSKSSISRCILKKQYSSGGYVWEREVTYG